MLLRLARCALALLLLVGCGDKSEVKVSETAVPGGGKDPGKPVTGDWLVIHSLSDPEQLNPLTSSDASSSEVNGFIFESLLSRNPRSLDLKPLIAESRPEISENKLAYTFKIRKDARFQDGRPVTGEDVLFSAKAIKCPFVNAPFLRVYFNSLVDAELVEPYTIRFVIKEPYFLNESVLGGIILLPRHYYDPENLLQRVTVRELTQDPAKLPGEVKKFGEQFNRSFNRNPLGSGPYKFSSWKTGREIELVRDPNYWGAGKEGLDQPHVDRLKFRIVNNMDAALTRLKSGSLDYMEVLQPVQVVRGTNSDRFNREFKKYEYYAPTYTYIGWNNNHPIFSDKRVRQAMTYLTDRKQIVDSVLFGLGEVVDSHIYLFRAEYDKSLVSYPFDPKKAVALLNEAGWKDTDGDGILDKVIDGKKIPLRFEIKINSGNAVRKSVALVLLDELKKHGIAASVRELDWTIFLNDVKNHQFDAVVLGWQMSTTDPDAYQVWHSSQAANKGSNAISYKNARVDAILEQYRGEFDAQKRIELYKEFQQILHDEQPYTFLHVRKTVSAVQRRFQGVEVFPDGLRPIDWWVPGAGQKYASTPYSAMTGYLVQRVLLMIPTFIGITLIGFFIMRLAPGDPAELRASGGLGAAAGGGISTEKRGAVDEAMAQWRAQYGLDKPLHVQYAVWMKNLATLSFGESFKDNQSVWTKITERVPVTVKLNLWSILVVYLVAIPLGIYSATHPNSLGDKVTTLTAFVLFAVPLVWAATMAIVFICGGDFYYLFPPGGLESLDFSEDWSIWKKFKDHAWHLFLPVVLLSYDGFAGLSRYMRASMLEVLRQDYVQVARAKGLQETVVILKHVLRNSLIPQVTLLASILPGVIGGSVIIETVFSIPGLGQLGFESVLARDYPTVLALFTVSAVLTLIGILISDLLLAAVDPRIVFGRRQQ